MNFKRKNLHLYFKRYGQINFKRKLLYFAPCYKLIGSLFFEKKYLSGKYFDESLSGWKWLLKGIVYQKVLGLNKHVPWPISPYVGLTNPENIIFDLNDIDNFQGFGCYFQNFSAKIYLGKGTEIARNVGIITANHDFYNLANHMDGKDVIIGNKCWIGMNAIILPGVQLGDNTIVGAGSVVTKSFPEGNLVIAGNPAKIIRKL